MFNIRQAHFDDEDALYRISLKTGHQGGDASALYKDTRMMGHIYAAPYLKFEPELAFVVTRNDEVVGFCLGTANTLRFAERLEVDWWPQLRQEYPKPDKKRRSLWTADERRCHMIHKPEIAPTQVVETYHAHVHLNLLSIAQGQRLGGQLLERWVQRVVKMGAYAVHIGANSKNERALHFWRRQGFTDIAVPATRTIWMGRNMN